MTNASFPDLGIAEPLRLVLTAENYTTPTPIQAQAIPALLQGRDLLGIAQTGTGKTAAFALPLLQQLAASRKRAPRRGTRALILAPTRELAIQISEAFKTYGRNLRLRHAVVVGGVPKGKQINAIARGVDAVIATPGRLLDLINMGHLHLDGTSHLVLDEADRMLDMGFIPDIRRVVAMLPAERQSMLFSATMPRDVERLAGEMLDDPLRIEVARNDDGIERIDQRVYHVEQAGKRGLLAELLQDPELTRVIVFTRTKHGADRLSEQLAKDGVEAEAIHGDKTQGLRERALRKFKAGHARVLVATDIAARGIDVDGVSHVVNYELPNVPESYVHRIGRTARAGASGVAMSFCAPFERSHLRDIERLTKTRLTVIGEAPRESRGPQEKRKPQGKRPGVGQRPRQGQGHGAPRRRAA